MYYQSYAFSTKIQNCGEAEQLLYFTRERNQTPLVLRMGMGRRVLYGGRTCVIQLLG